MKFKPSRFILAVFILIFAVPVLAGCSSEQKPAQPQIEAINRLRSALDLPIASLEFVEMTFDPNSPNGNLEVALYQDTDGRKYSVDPISNQVVEMDARALLDTLAPLTTSMSEEALRGKALRFMLAAMPGFETLQTRWVYEEGGKIGNHFFRWVDPQAPGQSNPTRAQIAFDDSGLLFAYYNTLILEK